MTTQTKDQTRRELIANYLNAYEALERAKKRAEDTYHAANWGPFWTSSTKQRLAAIEHRLAEQNQIAAQAKRDAAYTALFNALK